MTSNMTICLKCNAYVPWADNCGKCGARMSLPRTGSLWEDIKPKNPRKPDIRKMNVEELTVYLVKARQELREWKQDGKHWCPNSAAFGQHILAASRRLAIITKGRDFVRSQDIDTYQGRRCSSKGRKTDGVLSKLARDKMVSDYSPDSQADERGGP